MNILNFPPAVIIRHKKENLKKCTLQHLLHRPDYIFYSYPLKKLPDLENYFLLILGEAEPLTREDNQKGMILLDATWRYARTMEKMIPFPTNLTRRSLPNHIQTAYPRRQFDCPVPERGLASIEALAAAYWILGRDFLELLDHYYWKEEFLVKNGIRNNYI